MKRFEVKKYREDFATLSYQIIDTEERMIVDDALNLSDAEDLADAMNSLAREYADDSN